MSAPAGSEPRSGVGAGVIKLLAVYLQDHHAGAIAGVQLARRVAGANRETEYGEELDLIATEIEDDLHTLELIMTELGVSCDGLKDRIAWVGERLGRLKRNGTWVSYSPLSRVIELEGLLIGVTGKQALWEALGTLGEGVPGAFDLRLWPTALAASAAGSTRSADKLPTRPSPPYLCLTDPLARAPMLRATAPVDRRRDR